MPRSSVPRLSLVRRLNGEENGEESRFEYEGPQSDWIPDSVILEQRIGDREDLGLEGCG